MELKEGMYLRYKYEEIVFIGKITFISEVMCGLDETLQIDIDNCMEEIFKKDITNSSYNIIDLIEEGDYVNGSKVQEIRKNYIEIEEYSGLNNDEPCILKSEDIKSIVTKEQFESMIYKVGE